MVGNQGRRRRVVGPQAGLRAWCWRCAWPYDVDRRGREQDGAQEQGVTRAVLRLWLSTMYAAWPRKFRACEVAR